MIRLAIIGTASAGKSAVAKHLVVPNATVIDCEPLEHASRRLTADAYLLVCDKDLIDVEYEQLILIARARRPAGVALNKADTFSASQRRQVLQLIRRRLAAILPSENVVPCAADPVRIVLRQAPDGATVEWSESTDADVAAVVTLARSLIADASASLRVRARNLAAQLPAALRSIRVR